MTGSCIRGLAKTGVFTKSRKLHPIVAVRVTDNGGRKIPVSNDEGIGLVKREFGSRWQCRSLHRREQVMNFLAAHRGRTPSWSEQELRKAFAAIGKQYRLDSRGECVAMWELAFRCSPCAVQQFFNRLAGDDTAARGSQIQARALGKSSSEPLATEVRVVLPLQARAQVLDALIAHRLHGYLNEDRFRRDFLWVGAVKNSQPLELTWMLSQIIEKSLDNQSQGAVSQSDIAAFYDHQDLLLACDWLLEDAPEILDPAVVAAAFR